MDQKLRWGILGTGNIARQFAAGVRACRRGVLWAVGSRSEESARAFADANGVRAAHGSYDALIANPSVDAVYLSLPNSMHHAWTIKALRAGKHVLCEKPIAVTAPQAEEMFDAAAAGGRVLMEAFMYRTHPLTLAVAAAVGRGEIGELKLIRTSFCFRTSRVRDNIRFNPELAGGALMDVGCYCVNFARFFAGVEPAAVHAVGRLHPGGVDEEAAGTLCFPATPARPGGVLATFTCGMGVQADNTAYLCGTEGYIEVPVPWKPPADRAVYVVSGGVPPKMDNRPGAPSGPAPRDVRVVPAGGELYALEADHFADVVLGGATPRVSRDDSVGNMRVLDELRRQVGLSY